MGAQALSPLCLTGLRLEGAMLFLEAEGEGDEAPCPSCGDGCRRVHDRYRRSPLDLPWRGFAVRLAVTVRRFRCDNPVCVRKTFAEDFGPPLRRRSRFTADVLGYLREVGRLVGARPGARLAERSGAPASHDTVLRLVQSTDVPEAATPRVLGVDDLALRRGCRYATILVDMETHEPIDLLEGRDAETLATWLRAHPGVEVIVRDRGGAYADGARAGAPDAIQIADRFHLVKNVTDAFDELLKQRRWGTTTDGAVAPTEPPPEAAGAEAQPVEGVRPMEVAPPESQAARPAPPPPARPLSPTKQREIARRAARDARWQQVQDRRAQGDSIRRIAETLHLHRRTVRRLLDSAAPPHHRRDHPRPGGISSPKLAPYTEYLQQRRSDGCTNAVRLYGELVERGYDGSRTLLSEAVRPWRPPRLPKPLRQRRNRRGLDPRRLRRLLTRPPERLTEEERPVVQRLLDADETVGAAYTLVQRFRTILKAKDAAGLEAWLADARASGIPSLVGVANGMLADHAAVAAAVTETWSNGTVEGHVHKVKLLKRQGYGRAAFALLRLRVLVA
jgi:transposase